MEAESPFSVSEALGFERIERERQFLEHSCLGCSEGDLRMAIARLADAVIGKRDDAYTHLRGAVLVNIFKEKKYVQSKWKILASPALKGEELIRMITGIDRNDRLVVDLNKS